MRNYILVFIACVLFHAAGTWSLPLIDRDEPRFAEASREMWERKDFVVPFFNNQFRFDKPPLTYWFQVASYRLFGENDFAARFPTAIAAGLVAVVLMAWGRRLAFPTERESRRRRYWSLGGDNFHAVLADIRPRQGSGGRHVARALCDARHWAGWELFAVNLGEKFFVDFLLVARARVSGEGTDWMDAIVDGAIQVAVAAVAGRGQGECRDRPRPATAATMHVLGVF